MSINSGARVIAVVGMAAAVWLSREPADREPFVPDDPHHAELTRLRTRILAKAVVARELLAGRLDLAEATAVFAWVDRQRFQLPADGSNGTVTETTPQTILEWSKSAWSEMLADPAVCRRVRRLEERIAAPPRRPRVNEADCRELMGRAAAALREDRGRPIDRCPTSDLRLVAKKSANIP